MYAFIFYNFEIESSNGTVRVNNDILEPLTSGTVESLVKIMPLRRERNTEEHV